MSNKTELLIETVQKYPVLWDTQDPHYKHKSRKYKAWDEVSQLLGDDPDTLKNKWKNVRDSYGKHLRALQPLANDNCKYVERYKFWPWAKQMKFLKPFMEPPVAASWARHRTHEDSTPRRKKRMAFPLEPEIKVESTPIQQSTLELRPTDYDETDLIFLGYARIVKRMSALRQASTRYQVAQVLMQAEVEQANEESAENTVHINPLEYSDSE